jgi:molybdenum cofactor cytidylyltransferase
MTVNENVRIGGILLAAGGSSRMATPKQFVRFEGETLLRRAALAIAASVCDPIVAVLGAEKENAEVEIASTRVKPSFNRGWKTGMSSSIKLGLTELMSIEPALDAVLITLCDQPFVTTQTLNRLTERFLQSQKTIVAAEYGDIVGVPAIFSKTMFERLLSLDGDKGARDLIRDPDASVETVEIKEAALDIDTVDDLGRLKKYEHGS